MTHLGTSSRSVREASSENKAIELKSVFNNIDGNAMVVVQIASDACLTW